MKPYLVYTAAACAEIAGCFAFWAWLRLDKSVWWLAPGMVSLALFAWLLTLIEATAAGRAYAAYGGIYIAASLLWLDLDPVFRPEMPFLRGNPEGGIRRAIAVVAAALHDLEEKALAVIRAVDLEVFALGIAVVEDVVIA